MTLDNYNKSDIIILDEMMRLKAVNNLSSISIKTISEKTNYSLGKIRVSIASFLNDDYVRPGLKSGNSKTYYLTEKAISVLKEMITNSVK